MSRKTAFTRIEGRGAASDHFDEGRAGVSVLASSGRAGPRGLSLSLVTLLCPNLARPLRGSRLLRSWDKAPLSGCIALDKGSVAWLHTIVPPLPFHL
jgi:hypothetical protein